MAALDAGPASSNAVLFFNSNGGGGVEVHVGAAIPTNALNPLGPGYAPYQNDPQTAYQGTVINKVIAGNITIANPA